MSGFLTALPLLGDLLNKVLPDAEVKAKAQVDMAKLYQEGEFKELDALLQSNLAQAKINEIEAASSDPFVSRGRPAAVWVCVFGLAYEVFLRPLLPWVLAVTGAASVPPLPPISPDSFDLMCMLLFGLCGIRGLEKAHRVKQMVQAAK